MTQITDEMIEVANKAADEAKKEFQFANTVIPSLTAAYPLIRKQVLEEAARVCDKLALIYYNHSAYYDEQAKRQVCMKSAAEQCAQAIRHMAKEIE